MHISMGRSICFIEHKLLVQCFANYRSRESRIGTKCRHNPCRACKGPVVWRDRSKAQRAETTISSGADIMTTHHQLLYHVVFSTKNRRPSLEEVEFREFVFNYLASTA